VNFEKFLVTVTLKPLPWPYQSQEKDHST